MHTWMDYNCKLRCTFQASQVLDTGCQSGGETEGEILNDQRALSTACRWHLAAGPTLWFVHSEDGRKGGRWRSGDDKRILGNAGTL